MVRANLKGRLYLPGKGYQDPSFARLGSKRKGIPWAMLLKGGGFLLVVLAPRVPPRGSGAASWDSRRRRGTPERSSRMGMQMSPLGPAIYPLRVDIDLLGESEGVRIRMGTRPTVAGRV